MSREVTVRDGPFRDLGPEVTEITGHSLEKQNNKKE